MAWKFNRSSPLIAKGSKIIDNLGVIPRKATKAIRFVNKDTGELFTTTDLAIKKQKRNKALIGYQETYNRLLKSKSITIMLIVASVEKYRTVGEFMKELKKKLWRSKIETFGYFWQRDIGELVFKRHYHIMVAATRIDADTFRVLMKNKRTKNYKVVLCNNLNSFKDYLKGKEIYAPLNHRSYGKSQQYRKPLNALHKEVDVSHNTSDKH